MTKNPVINAFLALFYIIIIVMVMNLVTTPQKNRPDTFGAPIMVLSMLTLSVTVMAILFFYKPLNLFIDGNKKEAVNFFVKTVLTFGLLTVTSLILLYFYII